MKLVALALLLGSVALYSCNQKPASADKTATLGVNPDSFTKVIDGKQVTLFTLKNQNGIQVQITNYGGRIVSIVTPDKDGKLADVAMGYSTVDEYTKDIMNQSGIIGRFGNRICKGKFSLNGDNYTLAINNPPNSLHGGPDGFNRKVWDAEQEGNKLVMNYISPDMEEGYPGELTVKVVYELSENNELSMVYEATTTKPTIVNLTNHTYYNLRGDGDTTILDHTLQMMASFYIPVDSTLIPTGEIASVENTPFDFRAGKMIGKEIKNQNQQLTYGLGYDHNWVLDKTAGELALALKLSEATTGRVMEIYTTEPGMQFYCGNFMDGTVTGKSGQKYQYRSAVALEPQHFPDSPNRANFPSTVLNPGEKYYHKSVLKFYTE